VSITLEPIDISKDKMEMLQNVSDNKISSYVKSATLKKLCDGACCLCGGIPTQIATYPMEGATRIERYCDLCASKPNQTNP
jgi:hypothetical protein